MLVSRLVVGQNLLFVGLHVTNKMHMRWLSEKTFGCLSCCFVILAQVEVVINWRNYERITFFEWVYT